MTSQSEHYKRHKKELKGIKTEVKEMDFPDMLDVVHQGAEDHYHFLVGYFGEYDKTGARKDRKGKVSIQELTEIILRVERGIY